MLKMVASGTQNGKPVTVIVLGLSYRNLEELKKGRPIKVKSEDVHAPGYEILIFSGETEQSMGREMSELIGLNTKVHIDPRLADA